MFATVTLLTLVNQVSGTPYVVGGDTPAGTDCSGLVSWVTNAATGRPIYGDRFHTGNIEGELLSRGFQYGTQPGALVVGWNGGHTAVTLPDGTPVSSGEGGGVKVGGGGAYQPQFSNHMFLPLPPGVPPTADPLMAPPINQLPPAPAPPPPPGAVPGPPAPLPGAPVALMGQDVPLPPAGPFPPPPINAPIPPPPPGMPAAVPA